MIGVVCFCLAAIVVAVLLIFDAERKHRKRIGPWQSALKCDSCGCVDMRAHVYKSPCPRCGVRRTNVVVARMFCGQVQVKEDE